MVEDNNSEPSQARFDWLETYAPASLPYMVGFSIFVPLVLGVNIGLEFWLGGAGYWAAKIRQGLLNAGTMSTWGIPLTILLTEWITRMLARHYIATRQREAEARQREAEARQREAEARQREAEAQLLLWHKEQVAKWEERQRLAEAEGRWFTEPRPEPPPGINSNGSASASSV